TNFFSYSYSHPALALVSFWRLSTLTSSPLFPYTTLFRSGTSMMIDPWGVPIKVGSEDKEETIVSRIDLETVPEIRKNVPITTSRDRKSTRLNSSHVSISYAVFCLKKKKSKQVP